ncbi:MAG: RNB domain-containing ribonuclease [Alphaproteobacteria bacterium]|nr:RNB domain-containing ribonuclease [Alphaproteobacteria bacterium]MBV9371412.1 RNB domain-containing ribonuclease [Alphaproteobacteria bacterium]MBV9902349.1 RNB domain-containing ribonuclease [Alphaproteobacteria bacterium]
MARRPSRPGLPTREQILDFIASSDQPAGKREIGRAFGLSGQDKIALKSLLRDMADEGLIEGAPGRAFHQAGGVPKVTVLRVTDVDEEGTAWAVPERWESQAPEPRLRVLERKGRGSALAVGDRILARTEQRGKGYAAHPMKKLMKGSELVLGVVHQEAHGFWLRPVEKKERRELPISDVGPAEAGDLVLAEKVGRPPRLSARVSEVLGDPFAPRSFSLIAIHKHGIPHEFPETVLAEAERVAAQPLESASSARPEPLEGLPSPSGRGKGEGRASTSSARETGRREDLTHIPIVAIDPADARDHDDAVWAAADEDPSNAGGWRAIVAIADVSFYVRPGSALDKEARKRGNSVYFPDRVVPMLPETLSADVCSLKEGEDRAALVCHLQVTKDGQLKSWRFSRARVRIAANIAYEDAQAAIDAAEFLPEAGRGTSEAGGGAGTQAEAAPPPPAGAGGPPPGSGAERVKVYSSPCTMPEIEADDPPVPPELVETTLKPLWACWQALYRAREKRAPLELDLPERQVVLDEKGRIASVAPRERLDAHKLIEDYMIAANVAAAKALEAKKAPVMYRDHEPPGREKLVALKDYLATFGLEFALGQVVRPGTFNRIIDRLGDEDYRPQVMEQILRTQTQAYYAPRNAGHFGLALGSYAHFTSPIRRYADLIVHRSLVRAYGLGEGGLSDTESEAMEVTGELISQLERRAMEAERETLDRYVAAYLSERVGDLVDCRITGVQPFGFFATVEGLGGDGLVPVSTLGTEYFRYEEASQSLVGEESGERFTPGRRLKLRLVEANPVSGGLRFELADAQGGAPPARRPARRDGRRGADGGGGGAPRQGRRGRPANIRHQGRR